MMDLQHITNSSFSLRLVSALAHRLPLSVGYPLADFVARQIARRREDPAIRAVRANQWVITGSGLKPEILDQVVQLTLCHHVRCLFDLYHYRNDPEGTRQRIVLESSFQELAHRPQFERRGKRRGVIVAGLHLSNFDLILQWLCKDGLKPLVLTLPDLQGGRRMEYEIRRRTGMNLLPASVTAFRQAIKHLQQGGMVVTGIDRPLPNPKVRPRFFGQPAALPLHHIFLAKKASVPLVVAVTHLAQDGKYHVCASDVIEMDSYSDPHVGMLHNAEKVLRIAEEFIRQSPQQWVVPLPVWPQSMDLVPK